MRMTWKWRRHQKWRWPKNEDNLKNEDDLKNENNLKNEEDLKKIILPPNHLKRILPDFFFMTSHLDSHKTTDIKLEMLSGVQTGNGTPHGKYNVRGIAHAGRKDDTFMQRQLM